MPLDEEFSGPVFFTTDRTNNQNKSTVTRIVSGGSTVAEASICEVGYTVVCVLRGAECKNNMKCTWIR